MSDINTYSKKLSSFYANGTNNHEAHNKNKKYFNVLLKDITEDPDKWKNKKALDYGSGKGRNVTNLFDAADFDQVDGVDISKNNVAYCKETYKDLNSNFYLINGYSLDEIEDNTYNFAMSTIVLQHVCVHEMRYKIKKEIYRVLDKGGIFSFQMGYGEQLLGGQSVYSANKYNESTSNGRADVKIQPDTLPDLVSDLKEIGFKNITHEIHESFADGGHTNWVYMRCVK